MTPRRWLALALSAWLVLGLAAAPCGAAAETPDETRAAVEGSAGTRSGAAHCHAMGDAPASGGGALAPAPARTPCQWVTPLGCCDQPSMAGSLQPEAPPPPTHPIPLATGLPATLPRLVQPSERPRVPPDPLGVVLRL